MLISYFQFDYEIDGAPVDEADEALAATQNPWFLHIANRPAAEQQLSPRQGMDTHKSYFIFYPNFFHLVSNCPRLELSHWNRKQGCRGNRGLAGVLSLTGPILTSSVSD